MPGIVRRHLQNYLFVYYYFGVAGIVNITKRKKLSKSVAGLRSAV